MGICQIVGHGPIAKDREGRDLFLGADGQVWRWTKRGQVTVADGLSSQSYLQDHSDFDPARIYQLSYLGRPPA